MEARGSGETQSAWKAGEKGAGKKKIRSEKKTVDLWEQASRFRPLDADDPRGSAEGEEEPCSSARARGANLGDPIKRVHKGLTTRLSVLD
jgi:hypothetical protein